MKPENNLSEGECQAIRELKNNSEINIKRADKGSSIVIFNKQDKLLEGQIQLDDKENLIRPYRNTYGNRDFSKSQ